jgi:hypothetical protein
MATIIAISSFGLVKKFYNTYSIKPSQPCTTEMVGETHGYEKQIRKNKLVVDALAHREEFATIAALSQPLHNWIESIQEEILSFFSLQALQKIIQDEEVVGSWEFKAELIFFQEPHFSQG